jgi:PAS domain S-box-containing protein
MVDVTGPSAENVLQVLSEDRDRILCRGWRGGPLGRRISVLVVRPAAEHPAPAILERLANEYALKDELDAAWAVRPLALERDGGRLTLVLEDPQGEPLDRLLAAPLQLGRFLRLAIGIADAVGRLHQRRIVHKDIKPANLVVGCADGQVRLTGFGLASRLPRERQAPEPAETVAGTLAYMAPEQTGRMNRSIDCRSDLYSLGVALYQMLTGSLPFAASDPMEWVHCHVARRPVPPGDVMTSIPSVVSRIVMKLLAKTAEARYQTAGGVARDLRRCLIEWERHARIAEFGLGDHDIPDRLLIPEKLYGRTREIDVLRAAFDRVAEGGAAELVLVTGYSGIGKSSVVNELHQALLVRGGLFASGKFDQYKLNVPYSTVVQAFRSLIRTLLGKSEAELARWRHDLLAALGSNGRLIVDLVPELRLIIGDQPPVPELPLQQAQNRFQQVFRRFIGVFAQVEHPLALLLDDLQWVDAATLDLIEDLLLRSELRHLLLIGAYRDNEVDASHPLARRLEALAAAGAVPQQVTLAPLGREHIEQLIADALRCERAAAAALAQLVHVKTAGNPFFVNQFLFSLAEEGLLAFDHPDGRWRWDLGRIDAKGYTDNVVDLMVAKLTRLPAATQAVLQRLACLGDIADTTMLSIVWETSEDQVHVALWDAVRQELVERLPNAYRFVHDRVQEAAYSLIPTASRAEIHLRTGRLLLAQTPPGEREAAIFDIVNQLNRGASLIAVQDEREQLAELDLVAARRAKAATAYHAALSYLVAGAALLTAECWQRRQRLMFALEINRAECEFLTGALADAEERLAALSARAVDPVQRAHVACLRIDLYLALYQGSRAIAVGLDHLAEVGIDWSPHPTEEDARREYERVCALLDGRTADELIRLPLLHEQASLATLDVLTKLVPPAFYTDVNLICLIVCRTVALGLAHGHSHASAPAYVRLGMIAGLRFGDYEAACRLARTGYELVQQRGLGRFQAEVHLNFGHTPWLMHVRSGRDLARRAFEAARNAGDLAYAAVCSLQLSTNLLIAGDPLSDVQREAEHALDFLERVRFGSATDFLGALIALVRSLRGLTPKFGRLDDDQFDESLVESRFAHKPEIALAECWYWIRKLQGRFLAGDVAAALDASARAQSLLRTSMAPLDTVEFHFYSALTHAASCGTGAAGGDSLLPPALAEHHRQLAEWARHCPENFENRAALVGAEIARIEARDGDAMRLYEQAIRSARAHGFIQNEAIAYEHASVFYRARGFDQIADLYLRNARYAYLRWGAAGKVRQLDETYPHLMKDHGAPTPTITIGESVEHLDLATVIRVSQAISGEMAIERLSDVVMRMAIEHAGADRGLLILSRGPEQWVSAEATTSGGRVVVRLRDEPATPAILPESVLHYVLRAQESLTLDDAAAQLPYAADPYVRQENARSILCLPLMNQAKLIGVLYLENNLTPGAFAPGRIAVLKLLATQAAITLENTRLYRDLEQREAKIRRLVDANIIGIYIWQRGRGDGLVVDANDAFLEMVGYSREDVAAGRVGMTSLTPPEWLDRSRRALVELEKAGTIEPYEKEYLRKDGTRLPVLMGATAFDQARLNGVAFVLDLTERKRAEEILRDVQTDLAHANRVAAMGQLTASIAHEVNQPIAGIITNCQAALRWIAHETPNLGKARAAIERAIRDGTRSADVIRRVRNILKKGPLRREGFDVNDAVAEVIALTRAEAGRNGVRIETQLDKGLAQVQADRVQVQQVILNLVINAIEAMNGAGDSPRDLLITTCPADQDGVLIAVHDSGPGLDPAKAEIIFESFFTTKPGGMGMGLSICRSIVEAHGGELWVSANAPRGAVFQFSVPARFDEQPSSPDP